MKIQTSPVESVSLSQIAEHVKNDNFENEVLVFDHVNAARQEDAFPLRIDAHVICLCTAGSGILGMDLRNFDIKKNTLFTILPKNYISIVKSSQDFTCNVIACSKRIAEDVFPKITDVLPLLIHNRVGPVMELTGKEVEGLLRIYSLLRDKMREDPTPFLKHKILCLLQVALYEMMDIQLSKKETVSSSAKTRKDEIMARFILAVTENFRAERQVAYYANKLCITPKHLSSVVKDKSGKTAGEWIEDYVIMEAKVLLKTTDMTIQEVANYLNFANQSFFGKYFKQHTGVSPSGFRKKFS